MKIIRIVFVVLTLVFGSSQAQESAYAGELTVTVAAPLIRAMDPVFLKVTLENRGESPVKLHTPLGDSFGSLRLEIRREGERGYKRVRTKFSGLKGGEFPPTLIPPGDSSVCYEVLFGQSGKAVFGTPGIYELRAGVEVEGREVVSAPATITVMEISEAEREIIEGANSILSEAIGTDISDYVDVEKLASVYRLLGESQLKNTLQWILAIRAAKGSTEGPSRQATLESLRTSRKEMDTVTAEVVDFILAKHKLSLSR